MSSMIGHADSVPVAPLPPQSTPQDIKACPPPPPPLPEENSSPVSTSPKKWDTVEVPEAKDANIWRFDESWEFKPDYTRVIHSFDDPLPWETAMGVCASSGGSEGVFFVELKTGILVVKGSMTIGADLFANNLALTAGLEDVPKMKAVSYLNSDEWDPMVQVLWKLEKTNIQLDDSQMIGQVDGGSKLTKCLNRPFLLLLEFIRGDDLEELSLCEEGRLVKQLFMKEDVLESIGHLIAFDMFVNNWDRFPFVWQNEGNPKNIMFNPRRKQVFGIDHSLTSIDPNLFPENCDEYLSKVGDALDAIIRDLSKETPHTEKVRLFIKQYTNVDIGPTGSAIIQRGVLRGVNMIAEHLNREKLKEMRHEIELLLKPTQEMLQLGEESTGLNRINLDFLYLLYDLFAKKNSVIKKKGSIDE